MRKGLAKLADTHLPRRSVIDNKTGQADIKKDFNASYEEKVQRLKNIITFLLVRENKISHKDRVIIKRALIHEDKNTKADVPSIVTADSCFIETSENAEIHNIGV